MNTAALPINLDKLIHRKVIENDRVEFKSTWDEYTKKSVVRTICAFARDFQGAHRFFREVYSLAPNDSQVIYEFARSKIKTEQVKGFFCGNDKKEQKKKQLISAKPKMVTVFHDNEFSPGDA